MSNLAWINKLIDWELEIRWQILRRFRGPGEQIPPKPVQHRIVGSNFHTDLMPLSMQDDIELAAFAAHRGHHSIAEDYRVCAGYGGMKCH